MFQQQRARFALLCRRLFRLLLAEDSDCWITRPTKNSTRASPQVLSCTAVPSLLRLEREDGTTFWKHSLAKKKCYTLKSFDGDGKAGVAAFL